MSPAEHHIGALCWVRPSLRGSGSLPRCLNDTRRVEMLEISFFNCTMRQRLSSVPCPSTAWKVLSSRSMALKTEMQEPLSPVKPFLGAC